MAESPRNQARQPSEAGAPPADPIFETIQILEPEKPRGFRHQVSSKVKTSHWSSLFSCIAPQAPSSSADDAKDAEEQQDEQEQASPSAKWTWGTKKVRAEDMPCILFVGLDGAGKTTIINTLLEEARRLKVEEQRAKEEERRVARDGRPALRQQNGQQDGAGGGGGGGTAAASSRDASMRGSQAALSKAVTGVTEDRGTARTGGQTDAGTEDGNGQGAGEGEGGISEKARRARDAIQPPPPAPSERGMLYALPQSVLRYGCVLMDTPGGFFQRRRYLGGLQLATAVVLCVDAADESRFPVVRDFFAQHVLPEVCRRHLPLLLLATKRDVCDWGAAEDVALDLDLAILMAHVAAPWTAAHVVGGQLGPLREPLTWLLQQSSIVDHLWHSWPSSAPVLLHYQQANARYAVGMASKKAVELFHGEDDQEGVLQAAAGAGGGGLGAGREGGAGGRLGGGGFRVAAGPLPALAPSGSVHISAVTSLAPLGSTPQPSVGVQAPA